jgi:hypothetical protein
MEKINFNAGAEDAGRIIKIVRRFQNLIPSAQDSLAISMDITACHLNGCPLDLERLLNSDAPDFVHDVIGIRNNINRTTGRLENCFLPRHAAKEEEA